MNRLAAALLVALIAFLAGFSWHSWRTERAFLIREQENVLEFVSRHVDGYFLLIESGLLRLSLELTEGGGRSAEQATVLLNGLKTRNRVFLGVSLTRSDGTTIATNGMLSGKPSVQFPLDEHREDGRVAEVPWPQRPDNQQPKNLVSIDAQAISHRDASQTGALYRDFWNAEIHEKHELEIEGVTTEQSVETHTLLAHYRHRDGDGRFVHTMSVALKMGILEEYWKATDSLKNSAFWIMTDNGGLLNLYPERSQLEVREVFDKTTCDALFANLRQTGYPVRGQFDISLESDKTPHLVAFQRLNNYPFTVFISLPTSMVWANWWKRVQTPFFLSFMLLVLGMVFYRKTLNDQVVREQEQFQMREQLRISNERWKLALECAGQGIWETDYQAGEIRFSGRSPEIADAVDGELKMPLDRWVDLIHPEDRARAREAIQEYSSGKIPEFQIEPRVLCKDGQWKSFLVRGNVTRQDSEGRPIHVLGTVSDITAQKNSFRQLEKHADLLRQGLILFPTGVAVFSAEGSVIEANPALCRMFGYSEREIIGTPVERFFLDKEFDRQLLKLAISNEEQSFSTSMERVAIHKATHRFPIIYTLSVTRDQEAAGINFIAQIEDLSQRKQEQVRDMAKEILAAQEKERARLSRELHDEVGQLLTALRLTLKLVLQSLPDLENVESCINDGQRVLDDLIESIRSIANRIRPVAIDQLGLISALRSHLTRTIRPLGLDVTLFENVGENRLPDDLELCCFRVVQEALTNCLRYANAAHVEVRLTLDSSRLILAIKDDGTGFDISRYYSHQECSRSLGIVGMHERVAACGGELQIRSMPGQGVEVIASFDLTGVA